jgi:pSer/pThr/pTyr-binding forkhead associated (FHA) protein
MAGVGPPDSAAEERVKVARTAQGLPPSLEIFEAGRSPYRVVLDARRYVFGRDPQCTIPLNSDYVSWRHATLERRRDGFWVSHEQTRNGLLLDGRPLSGRAPLQDGSELRVADVRLVFHAGGDGPGGTKSYEFPEARTTPFAEPLPAPAGLPSDAPVPSPLAVDERRRRLLAYGRVVPIGLSPQEFRLLALLCERPGEVRWHDEIGTGIWGVNAFDNNQIHALVARVKKKLTPHGLAGHIVAVPGVGYRVE